MKVRFARLHEIVEDIALLKPKTDHDGHHPLDETAAPLAVCAETSFAPEDCGPQISLGEVVGRLDSFHHGEGPQRGVQLQDLFAHARHLRAWQLTPCLSRSSMSMRSRAALRSKAARVMVPSRTRYQLRKSLWVRRTSALPTLPAVPFDCEMKVKSRSRCAQQSCLLSGAHPL